MIGHLGGGEGASGKERGGGGYIELLVMEFHMFWVFRV